VNRIIIQIEDAALAELDDAASEERLSRAAFIREAVAMALAERRRRREIQEVIDSYTEHPQEKDLILPKEALRRAWPE
jgi:metal-responsive CopG/Arc/MetJ family transcriptional regulator